MSQPETVDCRVLAENTNASLHAHTLIAGRPPQAGDSVRVEGGEFGLDYGERRLERRVATVERSGPLTRLWMKLRALGEVKELFEVSFSERRKL